MDLLNSQQMTESTEENPDWPSMKCAMDAIGVKIQGQVDELVALKTSLTLASASQAKILVKQVLKRVEEVQCLVGKRQSILLQQLDRKQSFATATFFKCRRASGSFFDSSKNCSRGYPAEDVSDGSSMSSMRKTSVSSTNSSDGGIISGKSYEEEEQEKQLKRFHVLQELLQTEQTYVEEIGLILTVRESPEKGNIVNHLTSIMVFTFQGYRNQVTNLEGQGTLPPPQLLHPYDKTKPGPKVGVLFCNLDEIYAFHSKIFLPDLTTCIESIESVALCFIQRVTMPLQNAPPDSSG